jgi:pimeloyl-ACP methyl ester carboxylesterase
MIGKRSAAFLRIVRAVDDPLLGPSLYRLNVNRFIVRMMGREHVYVDPNWLSEPRLAEKLAVTRTAGARHASVRFITGELDPVRSRTELLALAERIANPILVLYGVETPPNSKAEMEALAVLPNIRSVLPPSGKLSVHEEFPEAVASAIKSFLTLGG